ncbi:hypothetical protein Hdeb2414_s0012g00386341 [Helianthus debilis subsp. tardiflorus]
MLCYDTSVDGLRNDQRELSHKTNTTNPEFKTKWSIERHANVFYTRKIFLDVQKEILKGKENSYIAERSLSDGVNCFVIAHQDQTSEVLNEFKVTFNKQDLSVPANVRDSPEMDIYVVMCSAYMDIITYIRFQHKIFTQDGGEMLFLAACIALRTGYLLIKAKVKDYGVTY